MSITLILFLWFIAFAILYKHPNNEKSRSRYIICNIILLMGISVCRNLDYGPEGVDTRAYCGMFKSIVDYSWTEIGNLFLKGVIMNDEYDVEIGYLYLQKIISMITPYFHVFIFIAQLFFYVPFYFFLKRYSHNVQELLFAFVFYVALIYLHANTGTRQFYAMGFGILFFLFSGDKRYKLAIISLLLGVTIHKTLILVILPYVLNFLDAKKIKLIHIITLILFPVVLLFPNEIIVYMGNFIGSERYANYGKDGVAGGAINIILLIELFSFICYFGIKTTKLEVDEQLKRMYAMVPFFTFLIPLMYSNGSMKRISMYMFLYLTLLFPRAIIGIGNKDYKKILNIAIAILMLVALITSGNSSYHFFWNIDPISTW